MPGHEQDEEDFNIYSEFYMDSMWSHQYWTSVISLAGSGQHPSSSILDWLKSLTHLFDQPNNIDIKGLIKASSTDCGAVIQYIVFTNTPLEQMCSFSLNVFRSRFSTSGRGRGECVLAQHGPDLP